MQISAFQRSQLQPVQTVHRQAFGDAEGAAEGERIARLVADIVADDRCGDAQGFVASEADEVLGSIFFTPLGFDNDVSAMLLSPVAVVTSQQGAGVGTQLIKAGLAALAEQGIELVLTYGDPAYYGLFGFQQVSDAVIIPPQPLSMPFGWQAVPLTADGVPEVTGRARCVAAFDAPDLW